MKTMKQKYATFKNHLRRIHYMWPPSYEAWKKARVSRGLYGCSLCLGLFKKSECQLDHIEPVEPINKEIPWNEYFNRLFVKAENYQVLCKECHNIKTQYENNQRIKK